MLILNGIWKNSFQIEASQLSGMGLWKVKKLYNLQSLDEDSIWKVNWMTLSPYVCTSQNTKFS